MTQINNKTRITASTLGVLLGLAGMLNHGIFEILQGNTPTNGYFIEALAEAHRFWIHGTEAAFTVVHNFLVTGICVVLAGLATIFWSLNYMHKKHGATVLLLLLILMTLVGGGIGHIVLILPTWAFATRINTSLDWWKKVMHGPLREKLSAFWIYSLAATAISWIIVMELGIFGYFPGQSDPDTILSIVFGFLFATGILACITFICAFAADIQEQNS